MNLPFLVQPPERDADGLWARLSRAQIGVAQPIHLRAIDRDVRTQEKPSDHVPVVIELKNS